MSLPCKNVIMTEQIRNSKFEIAFPRPPQDGCPKWRDRFAERGRNKLEIPIEQQVSEFEFGRFRICFACDAEVGRRREFRVSNFEFLSSQSLWGRDRVSSHLLRMCQRQ